MNLTRRRILWRVLALVWMLPWVMAYGVFGWITLMLALYNEYGVIFVAANFALYFYLLVVGMAPITFVILRDCIFDKE